MAGEGIGSTIADAALETGISKGLPWLAKKRFEAGRYYAPEEMRAPNLKKRFRKSKPLIDEAGEAAINKLAFYVRPPKTKGKGLEERG